VKDKEMTLTLTDLIENARHQLTGQIIEAIAHYLQHPQDYVLGIDEDFHLSCQTLIAFKQRVTTDKPRLKLTLALVSTDETIEHAESKVINLDSYRSKKKEESD
jgi:hypothetical protein